MTSKHGNSGSGKDAGEFASHHATLTRRYFLQLGATGLAALGGPKLWAKQVADEVLADPALAKAVSELEYLTPLSKFKMGGRALIWT